MAEVDGERGHGYFIPAKDSVKLTKAVNCENMPPSCSDDNACQGNANAMSHKSGEDKETVNLIWTAPSEFRGQVTFVSTVVGQNDGVSKWWENIRSQPINIQ